MPFRVKGENILVLFLKLGREVGVTSFSSLEGVFVEGDFLELKNMKLS